MSSSSTLRRWVCKDAEAQWTGKAWEGGGFLVRMKLMVTVVILPDQNWTFGESSRPVADLQCLM